MTENLLAVLRATSGSLALLGPIPQVLPQLQGLRAALDGGCVCHGCIYRNVSNVVMQNDSNLVEDTDRTFDQATKSYGTVRSRQTFRLVKYNATAVVVVCDSLLHT